MATITYTKITEVCGDEEYGDEFEYEVDDRKLRIALAHFLHQAYFRKTIKATDVGFSSFIDSLADMIFNEELTDDLLATYDEQVRDWFAEEAMEWYESTNGGV
jgi:hypothetical protein